MVDRLGTAPIGLDVPIAGVELILGGQKSGNVSAAARLLGVSRNTIYRKIPELAQRPQ